jgi:hypothetical protein
LIRNGPQKASHRDGISPPEHGSSSSEPFHLTACSNVVAEALIYFSCEKGVGVRIRLLMLATMSKKTISVLVEDNRENSDVVRAKATPPSP